MTDHIPTDIYRQCVAIAKSYYTMLRRRQELVEADRNDFAKSVKP